jgi:hypothetical protein
MAGYAYNRASFGGAPTALTRAYCRCVALELALKEELALIGGSGNGGHDVPSLLLQYANAKLALSPLKAQVNVLAGQLSSRLSALWCQDRYGVPIKVKAKSYPFMRYLRHQSDGWLPQYSSDADVQSVEATVGAIWLALKGAGVAL